MIVPRADDGAAPEAVELLPPVGIGRPHALAAAQPTGFGCRQAQRRDAVQRGLDRKQTPARRQNMLPVINGFQRNRLRHGERPDREAAQRGDMAEGPERGSEIARERADIGALTDHSLEFGMVAIGRRDQPQLGDLDQPWSEGRRRSARGPARRPDARQS